MDDLRGARPLRLLLLLALVPSLRGQGKCGERRPAGDQRAGCAAPSSPHAAAATASPGPWSPRSTTERGHRRGRRRGVADAPARRGAPVRPRLAGRLAAAAGRRAGPPGWLPRRCPRSVPGPKVAGERGPAAAGRERVPGGWGGWVSPHVSPPFPCPWTSRAGFKAPLPCSSEQKGVACTGSAAAARCHRRLPLPRAPRPLPPAPCAAGVDARLRRDGLCCGSW